MFKKVFVSCMLILALLISPAFALTKEEVEPFINKEVTIVVMISFLFGEIPYHIKTQLGRITTEEGIDLVSYATIEGIKRMPVSKIVYITDGVNEVGEIPNEEETIK